MRPVDVEEVAAVAEGVREGDRRSVRVNVEREGVERLAVVLARAQAEHHQAALGGLPVAEVGDVLDREAPLSPPGHGASSIS